MGQNRVDQPVLHGFRSRQEAVTLGVTLNLLKRLAGMMRHQLIHASFHLQDFTGVDLNIRRLS